jgi:hypothetical protein
MQGGAKALIKPLLSDTTVKRSRIALKKLNRGTIRSEKMNDEFKKEINCRYFSNDIHELERLIGKDLSFWLS